MKFIGFIAQLICLGAFLQSLVRVEMTDCSNGAGDCYFGTNSLMCYIDNNDTQLIKVLLNNCSKANLLFNEISVYKNYISNEYGNLLVDLDLPANIERLYLYNSRDEDYIRIATFVQNNGLTFIYCDDYLELETSTFFTNFTNIQHIHANYLFSTEVPSFANLPTLTHLRVTLVTQTTFNGTILNGTLNLRSLHFDASRFNGIAKGALAGKQFLFNLRFANNKLTFIEEEALTELIRLQSIDLSDNNNLVSVPNNIFEGLNDLTQLNLDNTPRFPLNALISARYLITLSLQHNQYETLDPFVFQQLRYLINLYLEDPLICDCRLQWTSFLSQYGISLMGNPTCSEPSYFAQRSITNPQIYVNCSQTQTYQCFSKLITCPINLVCYNTEDGHMCACPTGYFLNTSGECEDSNECSEVINCQDYCVNTEGSFHCACREGYILASNGYGCDDANECQEGNDGCQFGCSNTVGSYQCYCEHGDTLKNRTHCEEGIECELTENTCIDASESNYTCKEGYNLTISAPTCPNVTISQCVPNATNASTPTATQEIREQENELNILTTVLAGVFLVIIVLLTIVIIALLIYILGKSDKGERRKNAKESKETKTHVNPQNDGNTFLYNHTYQGPRESNLKNNLTSQFKSKPGIVQEYPTNSTD